MRTLFFLTLTIALFAMSSCKSEDEQYTKNLNEVVELLNKVRYQNPEALAKRTIFTTDSVVVNELSVVKLKDYQVTSMVYEGSVFIMLWRGPTGCCLNFPDDHYPTENCPPTSGEAERYPMTLKESITQLQELRGDLQELLIKGK